MTASDGLRVETPSGKDAAYENFPVGSWLLPAALRPHIACYYRFARAIDDIADNPDLTADTKIDRLSGFASAIRGEDVSPVDYVAGHKMRSSLQTTDISEKHCLDLITAFKQDALKNRYQDWGELVDYCLLSAAPVGRYLIDLHGGSKNGYGPSDALCVALQIINHLQDCKEDYEVMDRVYIPQNLMRAEGLGVETLAEASLTPPLRRVVDRVIEQTESLMPEAASLPGGLYSRRLAMESQSIINIANSLLRHLRQQDPLASRVKLSRMGYVCCCLRGVTGALKVGAGS